MIAGLIGAGLLILFMGGMGLKLFASGEATGRAECMAQLKEADDRLLAQATKISQDAADKVIDIDAAYLLGESQAKTRTIYVQKKGAQDVAKYPVFRDANCVLPTESLKNLNVARASFRKATDTPDNPPVEVVGDAPAKTVVPTAPVERRPLGKRP